MDGSPSDSPNLFTDIGSPPTKGEDTISIHVGSPRTFFSKKILFHFM